MMIFTGDTMVSNRYDELALNKRHWVLVADASQARVLEAKTLRGPLREVKTFSHPEGRLRERDFAADRGGRSFDSKGAGRHTMGHSEPSVDAENQGFARMLIGELSKAWQTNDFEAITLIAPPKFLGLLSAQLDPHLAKQVVAKIPKSMTSADADSITALVDESLAD